VEVIIMDIEMNGTWQDEVKYCLKFGQRRAAIRIIRENTKLGYRLARRVADQIAVYMWRE
jgi:hypothetical protein